MTQLKLTSAQEAALNLNKNILVEAGAGSGKTTILVSRYIKILRANPKLTPANILSFTFTKKAAAEMKQRIKEALTEDPFLSRHLHNFEEANISTIHGFATTFLKEHGYLAKLDPDFRLIEGLAQQTLLKTAISTAIATLSQENNPALMRYTKFASLSGLMQDLEDIYKKQIDLNERKLNTTLYTVIDEKDLPYAQEADALLNDLSDIYAHSLTTYTALKNQENVLDFNDLIELSYTTLNSNPELLNYIQKQCAFILLDEFQDTDPVQWALINLIKTPANPDTKINTFIVGDSKQSIYSFRGADTKTVNTIQSGFNTAADDTVFLSDNFRSAPAIINFVNTVFPSLFETLSVPKIPYHPLLAHKKDTAESGVSITQYETEKEELFHMCQQILSFENNSKISLGDMCILLRKNSQLPRILDSLKLNNIAYTIDNNPEFFRSTEALLLYNFLCLLQNPEDNIALIGFLCSPIIGMKESSLYSVYLDESDSPLLQKINALPIAATWTRYIIESHKRISAVSLNFVLHDFLGQLCHLNQHTINIENVSELINQVSEWAQDSIPLQDIIKRFEDAVNKNEARTPKQVEQQKNAIRIMTIHNSKGLEFPIVFLPHSHSRFYFSYTDRVLQAKGRGLGFSLKKDNDKRQNPIRELLKEDLIASSVSEEIRVMYVACTRSKKHLYISAIHSKKGAPEKPQSFMDMIDYSQYNFETSTKPSIFPITQTQNKATHEKKTQYKTLNALEENDNAKTSEIPIKSASQLVSENDMTITPLAKALSNFKIAPPTQLSSTFNEYGELCHLAFEYLVRMKQLPSKQHLAQLYDGLRPCPSNTDKNTVTQRISHELTLFTKTPLYQDILSAQKVELEVPFSVMITETLIEGRVDVLFQNKLGNFEIIDYKTNTLKNDMLPELSNDYKKQMEIYAQAIKAIYTISTLKISVYYTQIGKHDIIII